MLNRLDIRAAVAILDKESQTVLVLVRRARNGVIAQLGVIVQHRHARPLLEFRCSHNLGILLQRKPLGERLAIRADHRDRKDIQCVLI